MGRRNLFRITLVVFAIMTMLYSVGCKISTASRNDEGFIQYAFDKYLLDGKKVTIEVVVDQRKSYIEVGRPFIVSLRITNKGKYVVNLMSLSIYDEIFKLNENTGEWELLEETFSEIEGIYSTEGIRFFPEHLVLAEIYPLEGKHIPWSYDTCLRCGYTIQPGESILLQYVLIFTKEGCWNLKKTVNKKTFNRKIISKCY